MTGKRQNRPKRILQIGNWPPPMCGWSMNLVALRKVLESRGWDCQVMNINENRRVPSPEYIDVQDGRDYIRKIFRFARLRYAVHARTNANSRKGYVLALLAIALARILRQPALLTYCGGHQQTNFPGKPGWHLAFTLLFRISDRIFCNSDQVKRVLLTTGVNSETVVPIPHFSLQYVDFTPAALPEEVARFYQSHSGVFFCYVCYRPEYTLDFLAEAIRSLRAEYPNVGFMMVGPGSREVILLREFLNSQNLEDAVCLLGSVPHDLFLTLLSRSLAYIRVPLMDGISASVLEALTFKIPVLASDNGARPAGVDLWQAGDLNSLLSLCRQAILQRDSMVARIPDLVVDDNLNKLADNIEHACLGVSGWQSLALSRPVPPVADITTTAERGE
jgi:glycosyltransferase involved in cell wall biosynthesis